MTDVTIKFVHTNDHRAKPLSQVIKLNYSIENSGERPKQNTRKQEPEYHKCHPQHLCGNGNSSGFTAAERALTLSRTNSYICLAQCQNKFANLFTLYVLHPKLNVYSALKRQTVRFCEALKCCSSVKGLGFKFQVERWLIIQNKVTYLFMKIITTKNTQNVHSKTLTHNFYVKSKKLAISTKRT